MPVMLTEDDLSLRHLPEVSDYSFSFQIPTSSIPKGDDLMADDNTFFEGANNTILATPAPFGRATIQTPSLNFTLGPHVLGPDTAHQEQQNILPSKLPNPSAAHPERQTLRLRGTHLTNKELRRSEAEIPLKEDTNRAHQDREEFQEQHSCPSANATTSTMSHNTPLLPIFADSEARHSKIGLPQTEPPSYPASRTRSRANKEPENSSIGEGSQTKATPRHSTVADRPRPSASRKHVKRPSVAGGVVKSRKQKSAAPGGETGPLFALHVLRNRSVLPERLVDSFAVDKPQASDINLSPLAPTAGEAEQLLMCSEEDVAIQDNFTSSALQGTEPNNPVNREDVHQVGQGIQDTNMNLVDLQVDHLSGPIHASTFGDRDDDRDNLLTISQLSPRKRGAQTAVVKMRYDVGLPVSPTVPTPRAASASRVGTSRKRRTDVLSINCHGHSEQVEGIQHSSTIIPVPPQTNTSSVDQILAFASNSTAPSVRGSCNIGMAAEGSNDNSENRGGREETDERIVVDNDSAKIAFSSEMISTGECGSHTVETGSGSAATAKKDVKGSVVNGARTRNRNRKVSNTSLSVSGGRTLRSRSVSHSTSAREQVLRANERGKRLAQVRALKEARKKDKLGKLDKAEKMSGSIGGIEGSSCGNELKRSGMTYFASSTRSVQFEFSTNLRTQARKGEEKIMTRSTSLLSNSGGESTNKHKTLHSSEQAHRKENIHPVIPQPFQWATEQRVQERRKFDEIMKEKLREKDELEERKRKEREEEEEKEVRELRKRAVPKANPVPEWYKDVPKKRGERV